jgi:hypothetical protein
VIGVDAVVALLRPHDDTCDSGSERAMDDQMACAAIGETM